MEKAARNVELESQIVKKICNDLQITEDLFYSQSRKYNLVFARMIVSSVLLKVFNYSTIKVAKTIKRISHTTILNYLTRVKTQKENKIINYYIKYYETK